MTASATPILDREAPLPPPLENQQPQAPKPEPPKSLRNKVIGIILVFLFAALIALLDAPPKLIVRGKAPLFGILYLVLMFGFACFVVIIIHELGHLIAGWCMGFRFVSVRFGLIEITLPFRISFSRSPRGLVSGFAKMEPTRFSAIRVRMFVMIVAGCLANLASAFTINLLPSDPPFLAAVAMLSIVLGLVNLLPLTVSGVMTDGRRILRLLWPDATWKRVIALKRIAAELKEGVSPEELQPDVISSAIGIVDNSPATFIAHWVAYRASWDKGAETETARQIEIALQSSAHAPSTLRETLLCDAGSFQATKRKNEELAREWLAEIPETSSHSWLRLWVEGAILEARNDFQGALGQLDEIEKRMHLQHPEQTRSKSVKRWRSELQAKLNASAATATP